MSSDLPSLISSVGFPIAMCLWFMFRMEKLIQNNTEALIKLVEKIEN